MLPLIRGSQTRLLPLVAVPAGSVREYPADEAVPLNGNSSRIEVSPHSAKASDVGNGADEQARCVVQAKEGVRRHNGKVKCFHGDSPDSMPMTDGRSVYSGRKLPEFGIGARLRAIVGDI